MLQSISPFCKFPIRKTTTSPSSLDFLEVPYFSELQISPIVFSSQLASLTPFSLRHCFVSSPVNALCKIAALRTAKLSTTSCSLSFASSSFAKSSSMRSTMRCCSESGGRGKVYSPSTLLLILAIFVVCVDSPLNLPSKNSKRK